MLFAAHDPGAKNHIRPIYEYSLSLGRHADFVDLSTRLELLKDDDAANFIRGVNPGLFVGGCSMNQAEWALERACNSSGIPTVMVVDISAVGKLEPISPADFPNRFLVTNHGCVDEIMGFGASPDTTMVTGSAHLERLSMHRPEGGGSSLRRHYGLGTSDNVVSFFCSPDTDQSINAVLSLARLLPATRLTAPAVI
ncbi:MAG: hypothetical protein QGF09_17405, partial [Rhodospirillales bacterium]|nr:hypothetical protein [Rhodospirillales bacterium]